MCVCVCVFFCGLPQNVLSNKIVGAFKFGKHVFKDSFTLPNYLLDSSLYKTFYTFLKDLNCITGYLVGLWVVYS